jgi:hypothetical protein
MIQQGLVALVQAGLGSPPLATAGYAGELPKDAVYPAWALKLVSGTPNTGLQFFRSFGRKNFDVTAWAPLPSAAMALAKAIDAVLHGYRGTLTDPDAVYVDVCMRIDDWDGPSFSDTVRNWSTRAEYEIFSNAK